MERLAACAFTKIAVTDTIAIGDRCDAIEDRLVVLSVDRLLGEAIHRIHHDQSVSALFDKDGAGTAGGGAGG
jgi:ribose-phosphate pyrophosphokinase